MFERFTDRARRAVVTAQEEARMLGHNHIGSEHLLLGVLHVLDGELADVLAAAGITVETARAQVGELAGPGDKSPGGHIPFTQRARKVLELSLREALEQSSGYIGTEHLLLAVIREADGMGAQVLERLGGSLSDLRQRVLEAAKAGTPGPAAVDEGEKRFWARDWQRAQGHGPEPGDQHQPLAVARFRQVLASVDERLGTIERHLGIVADAAAASGFRGLTASVDRHLGNIERHLGIAPGQGAEPGQQTGEEGPSASAE